MKKIIAITLALTLVFAFAACGGAKTPTDAGEGYTNATEVLVTVFDAIAEESKFPVAGGDEENQSFEAPAKYAVEKADELANAFALPEAQAANIEDAATAMHAMMANNFSGAAYILKADADAKTFADEYVAGLNGRQWMCGMPEKYVVIGAGNCVITAYGLAINIESVKTAATTALTGATVLAEGDITE